MRYLTGGAPTGRVIGACFGLLMVLSLLVVSAVSGRLSTSAMEADNVMRLVQIQDLLKGQGWFDLHQARLGPPGGTAMHWSRLADVPVLVIKGVLDVFLPSQRALDVACLVWPPLSVLLVVWGLMTGARRLGGCTMLVFTCIIAATILFRHPNFLSGSIDHHNLQLGFLAIALGFSLDRNRAPVSLAAAGAALASSIAIGVEVYAFVGVFCVFHALDWALTGAAARRGAVAFGGSLALLTTVFFAASIAPAAYGVVHCDALSLVTLCAAVLGGAGLAGAAAILSNKSVVWRMSGLGIVGIACATMLAVLAPQCLGSPLDELQPIVRTLWLEKVDEARPLFALRPGMAREVPFMAGITLIAMAVSAWRIWTGTQRRAHVLFLALLLADFVLTLQQVRFYTFGHLFAVIPLAFWVATLFARGREPGERGVAYVLALAVSVPLVWGVPGIFFATNARGMTPSASACGSAAMLSALEGRPDGRVLAVADVAPNILRYTRHSVLHGHYHRNATGIEAALSILTAPSGKAVSLMRHAQVDYVLSCPGHAEMSMLATFAPRSLAADLSAGAPPGALKIIHREPDGETLFAVEP
ncbi:MAG: hypothetical protein V7675_10000 [Hyphomonas sp.]|uniref:hypothetical protein n=1 Tax=Hyphomonas sp. TaxID=87 RepID=UPI003002581A